MKMRFPTTATMLISLLGAGAAAQNDLPNRSVSLSIRTGAQIEPADAAVIAARQAAIVHAAEFYDYSLDGSWSYEQAVCPLAPEDILLSYSKRLANGVSSFSAVVPRQGGLVRIIPLAHGGTAPSVTPWGEHSYYVFNSMTAADRGTGPRAAAASLVKSAGPSGSPGGQFLWGLCYVALVNERQLVSRPDRELHTFTATDPFFKAGTKGESELSFTVRDDRHYYSVWQLDFSATGALVRADRVQHMLSAEEMDMAADSVFEPGVAPAAGHAATDLPVVTGTVVAAPDVSAPIESRPVQTPAIASATSISGEQAVAAALAAPQPRRKVKAVKSEVHVIPETPLPAGRPIPDGGPLVSRPVPQG